MSRPRTFRMALRPTQSLSPHNSTGRPVSLASSTSSVKSAWGRLWAPLGAVKAIRPAAAKIAASFSPSARAMAVELAGVHRVKPPELPAVASDSWVAPLVWVTPMLTALAIIALIGDLSAGGCPNTFEVI